MKKTVVLKRLELTNYRNIMHQVLDFNGSSKIIGENRIGKTNTIEALYWLLSDKLFNGSSDITQIKPLHDTKVTVEVKAIFLVDEKQITLGKKYAEEWVKTRGEKTLTFKGHSTSYLYNDVECGTKKQFDSFFKEDFGLDVKEYQGIDLIQMLINPLYLGKMGDSNDWTNLRNMIINIVGDVSDGDVFAAKDQLRPIEEDLKINSGRTDQVIKQYRDFIKTINEDIIRCDGAIETLTKTTAPSEDAVFVARKGVEECDANILSMKKDDGEDKALNLIDQEILNLKNKIIELKRADLENKNQNPNEIAKKENLEKRNTVSQTISDLSTKKSSLTLELNTKKNTVNSLIAEVSSMAEYRTKLIKELEGIDAKMESPEIATECPTCHRPYDEEQKKAMVELARATLNKEKESLIEKGKSNSEKIKEKSVLIDDLKNEISELEVEVARYENSFQVAKQEFSALIEEYEKLQSQPSVFNENPSIYTLEKQIQEKEAEKQRIRHSNDEKQASVNSLIAQEQMRKESFQQVINDYEHFTRIQSEIAKKQIEKKDLQSKLISFEQKVEMVKEFVKTKLEMLDDNIKRVFDNVSFMLIEPQVNGGYSTVCKPYIRNTNVLWKSGSKSEQLITGVAICEKIKAALNLPDFPFIFDEGGEVSSITFEKGFETRSQLICVQVKDGITNPVVMTIDR